MRVKVRFLAGRKGNVEPSTIQRFSKSLLRHDASVVNRPEDLVIGSVPE
jgi:hypothetical protein